MTLQETAASRCDAATQPVSAASPAALTARDMSKEMSLFELDESLCLLLDSAWEAAEENNGEVPPELQQAILSYCEAFGEKVDNIARYIRAQEAVMAIAKTEAERYALRKARAENVVERLKALLKFFMDSRNIRSMKGRLHTIALRKNSHAALVFTELNWLPPEYRRVSLTLNCAEILELLAHLPVDHHLREHLGHSIAKAQPDNAAIRSALEQGRVVEGAALKRGEHVRLV
jgi:hypothetical protein